MRLAELINLIPDEEEFEITSDKGLLFFGIKKEYGGVNNNDKVQFIRSEQYKMDDFIFPVLHISIYKD